MTGDNPWNGARDILGSLTPAILGIIIAKHSTREKAESQPPDNQSFGITGRGGGGIWKRFFP